MTATDDPRVVTDPKHPLYGASIKLHRAHEQYVALGMEMQAFARTAFYRTDLRIDPNTEVLYHSMKLTSPLPVKWGLDAGDCVHNLRCALDYLVYQLILLEGKASTKRTQFPIYETDAGWMSGHDGKLKGVAKRAQSLIKAAQPFATGEGRKDPLFHLAELSNWDKHSSINVARFALEKITARTVYRGPETPGPVVFAPREGSDDMPLYGLRIPKGPEPIEERARDLKLDGDVTFAFQFKDPASVDGLRVADVLAGIRNRVAAILRLSLKEFFQPRD